METLVFETNLGHAAVARTGELLQALTFGHSSERAAIHSLSSTLSNSPASEKPSHFAQMDFLYPGSDDLVDRICAFAEGEEVDFDDLPIDQSHLTPFGRRVTDACRGVAWGETVTYGELARRAGQPGAARAVGSVMARNRMPLVVPCHRVVPASGGLGGFSAPQGVTMKQRLLDMEQQTSRIVS